MKKTIIRFVRAVLYLRLHGKYKDFTMASGKVFWNNMLTVGDHRHVQGCVIECGVWRGGMAAGMADVMGPEREYFLFDSFEGLPAVTQLDGDTAKAWQADKSGSTYFDNCSAPIEYAEKAMKLSSAKKYTLVKGWFENTVTSFVPPDQIAVLRLDGDWYESTLVVLRSLWKYMAPDGIIIVDDYYAWDGCSRAVHDYLSETKSTARLRERCGFCIIELRNQE